MEALQLLRLKRCLEGQGKDIFAKIKFDYVRTTISKVIKQVLIFTEAWKGKQKCCLKERLSRKIWLNLHAFL